MAAIRIRGGAEAVAVIGSLPQHCNSQADRSACGRITLTARQCCADDTPHPLSLLRDSDPGVPTLLPRLPFVVAARRRRGGGGGGWGRRGHCHGAMITDAVCRRRNTAGP